MKIIDNNSFFNLDAKIRILSELIDTFSGIELVRKYVLNTNNNEIIEALDDALCKNSSPQKHFNLWQKKIIKSIPEEYIYSYVG